MVDDEILAADRGEAIALEFAHAFGIARREGREFQFGALGADDLRQRGERQLVFADEIAERGQFQLCGDEFAHVRRRFGAEFDPDDIAAPALAQGRLEGLDQIVGVLGVVVEFDVEVAHDAEQAGRGEIAFREQHCGEGGDHVLKGGEAGRGAVGGALRGRDRNEALQLAGQADQAAEGAVVIVTADVEHHRHFQIGNEGEGMGRVDGDRRDCQEDVIDEMGFERGAVRLAPVGARDDDDSLLRQPEAKFAPDRRLVGGHVPRLAADLGQKLGRRQAVEGRRRDARLDLLDDARNAHHEEFVEIIGRNRQEAQAFEQRVALVQGFFEHPAIKSQPRQFAVDETRGRLPQVQTLRAAALRARIVRLLGNARQIVHGVLAGSDAAAKGPAR